MPPSTLSPVSPLGRCPHPPCTQRAHTAELLHSLKLSEYQPFVSFFTFLLISFLCSAPHLRHKSMNKPWHATQQSLGWAYMVTVDDILRIAQHLASSS